MNKLMMQAIAKTAQKFGDKSDGNTFNLEKLSKIMTLATISSALVLGSTASHEAHAMDQGTYQKLGAAAGAIVVAKSGNKLSSAERAGATLVGGLLGYAVGSALGAPTEAEARAAVRAEERARERQRRHEEAEYRQWERQAQSRNSPRQHEVIYVQDSRRNDFQDQQPRVQHLEQTKYDPVALGMPDILAQMIKRTGAGGLSTEGRMSLQEYPMGLDAMKAASDALIRGGRMYSAASKSFSEAQLAIGSEGVDIRASAGKKLVAVEGVLQNKTSDWVRVRNSLAEQGFDVTPFDSQVSSEFSSLRQNVSRSNSTSNRYRP
jgi:hypothetical protein